MQKKLLGVILFISFHSAYAESTVVVDEVSTEAPKAVIVEKTEPTKVAIEQVQTDNLNTVNLEESIKLDPNVEPEKTVEVAPISEVKIEKTEPVKPELVKETVLESAKTEVSAPVSIEVALPVKKVKPHVVVLEERPMSQSERIRAYRQKLEDRNLFLIQKKMEEVRLKQEMALAKKLSDSMNQTIKAIDEIK